MLAFMPGVAVGWGKGCGNNVGSNPLRKSSIVSEEERVVNRPGKSFSCACFLQALPPLEKHGRFQAGVAESRGADEISIPCLSRGSFVLANCLDGHSTSWQFTSF